MEFALEGHQAVVRPVAQANAVAERLERYRGAAGTDMSTEDILALTRR